MDVVLKDTRETTKAGEVKLRVEETSGGLEIYADEYGTKSMQPGFGPIAFLEYWGGELRLHAWTDIGGEEPTHTLNFQDAKESNRAPDEDA